MAALTCRVPLWLLLSLLRAICVDLPAYLAGLILVPIAASCVQTGGPSRWYGRTLLRFAWKWMSVYQNDEDGVDGLRGGAPEQQWWADRTAGWSQWRRIVAWSALRNSSNGLRFVPVLSPPYYPERIRWLASANWLIRHVAPGWPLGSSGPAESGFSWAFAWQGIYAGLILGRNAKTLLQLGWDFRPGDEGGASMIGTRLPRAAFKIS